MLFCLPLKDGEEAIFEGESQLDLDQISGDLMEIFNRTFYSTNLPAMSSDDKIEEIEEFYEISEIREVNQIDGTFAHKLKQFNSHILETLRSRNYYIVREQFCLNLPLFYRARSILDEMFTSESYFIFAKNAHTFVPFFGGVDTDLTLILNEGNPEFDCSSTKPECLNDCLKAKVRLSKLFYNGNESGIIYFEYKNETTLRDYERGCFEKCENNLCLLSRTSYPSSENTTGISLKVRVVRSSHSISTFSYWIQMAGLISGFFATSVYDLAFKPFEILNENRKKLILASKMLITLLCLVAFLLLSTKVIGDFIAGSEDFSYKTSQKYLSTPENVNLVLCVPVIDILNRYNDNPNDLLSEQVKQMNFSELESKTNGAFAETVNEIYLETLGRRSEVSYRLLDKVMFTGGELFSRCFQVFVDLNEPRYRSFLQASRLKINMKHQFYSLYLLPESQTFHSSSHQHLGIFKYEKKINIRGHEVCRDYSAEQREGLSKCVSLENCVDQCAQEDAIEQGRNISAQNLIDKQIFSADQWSGLFPDFSDEAQEEYDRMKTKCRKNFSQDCDEISLSREKVWVTKEDYSLDYSLGEPERVEKLKISYTIETTQYDASSFLAVSFDWLTVEGIFFNLNAHNLLITITLYFKTKFKLKRRNALLLPIHLLCAAGFAVHIWTLFDQVQNDGLVDTKHIREVNTKSIPEMLFCVDFDHSPLDPNEQLTGNYLEEITRNMTIESLFSTIAYLSPENEWKLLNESDFRVDERVSIDTVYYFGMKCFRLILNVQYEFRQFYFEGDLKDEGYQLVLSVRFDESSVHHKITLFTKTPDKLYLSEPISLSIADDGDNNDVRQKSNEVKNEDKFFFLRADSYRSLSSLFPERDAHSYLANLKANFKQQHNSTTMEMPLEREEFGLKINDTLFREFYEEIQLPKDQQMPSDFIYNRQVFDNSLSKVGIKHFTFRIHFDEETLEFRNKNNVAKFVLQLCNAFGLWLSMEIFSLFALDFKLFSGASWKRRDWAFFSTKMKPTNPELSINIWTVNSIEEVRGEIDKRSIDANFELNGIKSTETRRKTL